jgi:hypothetical protein
MAIIPARGDIMRKYGLYIIMLAALMISFGLGYMLAPTQPVNKPVPGQNKTLMGVKTEKRVIDGKSQIKLEQEYLLCQHLLVSDFPDRDRLLGKSLEEIRQLFTVDNGFPGSTNRQFIYCPFSLISIANAGNDHKFHESAYKC